MVKVVMKVYPEQVLQLRHNIDRFESVLHEKVGEVLEKWGIDATEAMQANHAADAHAIQRYINRTYELSNSIGWSLSGWTGSIIALEMFAEAAYAYDIESGTVKSRPFPFFWQEVYRIMEESLADLQAAGQAAVASATEGAVL